MPKFQVKEVKLNKFDLIGIEPATIRSGELSIDADGNKYVSVTRLQDIVLINSGATFTLG